ncbi:MAG: hypothetical protein GC136_06670 [Alphaproteobacteria bacterium]|nr:hypothetical protein [Alphaproteobacteria bacterium]
MIQKMPANDAPHLDEAVVDRMVTKALLHAQEKSNVIPFYKRPLAWGAGAAALAACLVLLVLPVDPTAPEAAREPDFSQMIMFDMLADLT